MSGPLESQELAAAAPTVSNVTASRGLNTTYSNATGRAILVMATVRCVVTLAAGSATVQGKADGLATPTTVVSGLVGIQSGLLNEDNTHQAAFVALAGQNYRLDSVVANGTATLGSWFEIGL